LTVDGRSYTQPIVVTPDPRVAISPAALNAQFQLQQRMVAGITATYRAFNDVQQLRAALAERIGQASNTASAAQITSGVQALETALTPLVNGPNGLGAAHRDLGRRLNDMLVGDVEPTPSVIAGVDGPCRAIDAALDGLRRLQTTTLADLNGTIARAGLPALPSLTLPPAPSCAVK